MNKNFQLKLFHLVLIIGISLLFGYYVGIINVRLEWKNYTPVLSVTSKDPPVGSVLDMKLFYDILDRVNERYYDKGKIDSKKILHGAISGMLNSLEDPYTSFFPPKENKEFKSVLAGEFQGIGAELGVSEENIIMVISPLDNSPAEKSGIKSGDLILKVDESDTRGWTLAQAVEKIRGPKGTKVKLSILREGDSKPKNMEIVRDVIQISSVRGWVKSIECTSSTCKEIDPCKACSTIAYIRLAQFGDKTNEEWVKMVNSLSTEILQNENIKGVILDLRNNPGGYLNDAVFIASEFLKNGAVVIQEDNKGERKTLSVSRSGLLTDYPLLVLINKGSASASEIVAGALLDHKRARLVGEKSFGKGTIQEAVDIDGDASIHISIAKWLTPTGRWVDKQGLTPDIEIKFDERQSTGEAKFDNQLGRAIQELVQ